MRRSGASYLVLRFGLTALLCLVAASARAQEISISAYQELIQDYRSAAERNMTAFAARDLKRRFERMSSVRFPDGSRVPVDNQKDIVLLDESARRNRKGPARAEIIARARALDAALTEYAPLKKGDPKQKAKAILAAPEFQEKLKTARPPRENSWWERTIRAIADWINKWLRQQRPVDTGAPSALPAIIEAVRIVLYTIAGIGALIAVYFLVRYLVNKPQWFQRKKRGSTGLEELTADSLPDPLATSKRLAAEGDYRGALRLAYIAALRRLSANGLLILQENRTNWEYQRQLRRRSTVAYDVMLPATRLFDEVWYGKRPATPNEYAAVVAAYDALPNSPVSADGASEDTKRNFSTPPGTTPPPAKTPREGDNPW